MFGFLGIFGLLAVIIFLDAQLQKRPFVDLEKPVSLLDATTRVLGRDSRG
jgi:hypothetical protein